MNVKKSIQYAVQGSELTTSECEYPPVTTRPVANLINPLRS